MDKVLVIGPHFYHFVNSVSEAFKRLGYDVETLSYDTPVTPFRGLTKLLHKLSFNKQTFRERNKAKFQPTIINKFDSVAPKMVFIMNGELISTETMEYMQKKSVVALWLFDSLVRLQGIKENLKYADHIFCYDSKDVEILNKEGFTAHHLPQAVDDNIYRPLDKKKIYDVSFVGDLYVSKRRQEYVQYLIEHLKDRRIKVVGNYKPWYKNPIKCLFREHRDIYTNKNASPEEVNKLYSQSKVVLNIHHEQQTDGANPKVFEIAASGAFQVCDTTQYIKSLFSNGEIALYTTKEEMIKVVESALNEGRQEASEARKLILENHTYTERMKMVLDICGINN